jgi:hypothetical protein
VTTWDSLKELQVTPLRDDLVDRFLRRASRASAAGLLGIMEMEDLSLDPATRAALEHLSCLSQAPRDWDNQECAKELHGILTDGYFLGRIVLLTVLIRPNYYTATAIGEDTNMIRLLAHMKLISYADVEELIAGPVEEAVGQLAAPFLRRGSHLRKRFGSTRVIDVVFDGFQDGLKLALSEQDLYTLLALTPLYDDGPPSAV